MSFLSECSTCTLIWLHAFSVLHEPLWKVSVQAGQFKPKFPGAWDMPHNPCV